MSTKVTLLALPTLNATNVRSTLDPDVPAALTKNCNLSSWTSCYLVPKSLYIGVDTNHKPWKVVEMVAYILTYIWSFVISHNSKLNLTNLIIMGIARITKGYNHWTNETKWLSLTYIADGIHTWNHRITKHTWLKIPEKHRIAKKNRKFILNCNIKMNFLFFLAIRCFSGIFNHVCFVILWFHVWMPSAIYVKLNHFVSLVQWL